MAVAGYNVYIEGVLVATVTGTTAEIIGLAPGSYHAQVSAFDDAGNQSAESSSVLFTVPTPETLGDTFPGLAISGAQGELALDTTGATIQGSEPWPGDRSVWATWVAPTTGRFAFDALLDQVRDTLANVVLSLGSVEGYWRLDEGGFVAVDDTGASRHGVYLAGHSETPGSRELDATAAQFDGAAQRVQIPDDPAFSIGPAGLTVLALVRVDQPAPPHADARGRVGIVAKPGEWELAYTSSAASGAPGSFDAGTPSTDAAFTDADYQAAPAWVMLLATFDPPGSAGSVNLYRSNALRATSAYVIDPARPASPQPVQVGLSTGGGFLLGAVSDVAVWSRVLTSDEIDRLYTEFAGVQHPPAFHGVAAQGVTTTQGDMLLTFTQNIAAGDTLELWVASEYQAGANTIFDPHSNNYLRVMRSRNDGRRLGKLVSYRCDVTTPISAGDVLTIRPATPVGIRAAAVLRFAPLGALDDSQVNSGSTLQPPATPAVHPTTRDDRVVAAAAVLGPPGDSFIEDDAYNQALRIGTTSFDAGVPVTRSRIVVQDGGHQPGGWPNIIITNPGVLVPAGTRLHVHVAHTYVGAGPQAISDSAGNTWAVPTAGSQADGAHTVRSTWYRSLLTADWPAGGRITITGAGSLSDYSVIVEALTGDAAPSQVVSATNVGQSATSAPTDPASIAGLCVGVLAWVGPASDTISLPPDWQEITREGGRGGSTLTILLANPVKRGSHEVVWSPDLLTAIRTWVNLAGYLAPAAPTGGSPTPADSNITLNLALLNSVPLGADVPYQPRFDAAARDWITITLAHLHP